MSDEEQKWRDVEREMELEREVDKLTLEIKKLRNERYILADDLREANLLLQSAADFIDALDDYKRKRLVRL